MTGREEPDSGTTNDIEPDREILGTEFQKGHPAGGETK
jgi:hypothetical protein